MRLKKRSMHYYNPVTISFGPYHHGKPELQAAEKLKNCGMRTYISEAGKSIEDFFSKVLEPNAYARSCYVIGSRDQYDDEKPWYT